MSSSNLIRWSGLAAFVGGVLLIVFDGLDVALFSGQHGREVMTTSAFFVVQTLGLVALMLTVLGLVGLYARQAEQVGTFGLMAFLVTFTGTMMLFGLQWGEPFLGPLLAEEAPEVLDVDPSGVLVAGFILTLVLFALGWLFFGLASLRARVLPRGAAGLLMVGAVLFFALALLELPLWAVVLGAALAWMGYGLWSDAGEPALGAAEAAA